MADDGPWLNVPQTAVLEVTRDIELVVGLSAKTTPLLIIKANQLLARIEIPLEANADADQRRDAVEQARTALRSDSANRRYLEALQRVRGRLVAGVRTKARRTPRGPYESLDRVEFIGAELEGLDAIDKKTGTVILFDLLINLYDYVEHMIAGRRRGVPCTRPNPGTFITGGRQVGVYGRSPAQTDRLGAVKVG
jgi:hypothetical protein